MTPEDAYRAIRDEVMRIEKLAAEVPVRRFPDTWDLALAACERIGAAADVLLWAVRHGVAAEEDCR